MYVIQDLGGNGNAVAARLLQKRGDSPLDWDWLSKYSNGTQPDKKSANKFLLACILDYRMTAEVVWRNAAKFAESRLGDPDNLWEVITEIPEDCWKGRWRAYALHRFPDAHNRVWKIGKKIVQLYSGDARRIWTGIAPNDALRRLITLGVGPVISRMVVGALLDCNQVDGSGDVKPDLHVTRVLGRILIGRTLSPNEAISVTRKISPANPWLLDGPLYVLGKRRCGSSPQCQTCYMADICCYSQRRASGGS